MLTRDQIFATNDLKRETVDVPEWGGQITVEVMSGAARDAFGQATADSAKSPSFFEAALVVATAVGDDGKPLFTADDIPLLQQRNAAVISRIAAASMVLNGIGATATEDAEKNSDAALSGSSGSDSLAS
ncbi:MULTISPECIES: hypothetical protein [unclassified Caballeronia]|uniref:hypothetical protein n=1 Tax=unclassified Caballeronia TaxID=2646786 RepID=UPI00285B3B41|nr:MULTISPECIES: hypothetical protein [unclassified Caballeronia]MDR5774910.1 hypothetical protein [Caballeronia sp. LZ002]MDR5850346.1 hypothetical protein [Caballeronia sp. LZ003]